MGLFKGDVSMICPTCKAEGMKSRVFLAVFRYEDKIPQERYWDEDGKWHLHEFNPTTKGYECTNGHTWEETHTPLCWCMAVDEQGNWRPDAIFRG
jgi:hypothetical protein